MNISGLLSEFEPEREVATFLHFGDDLSLKIWWLRQSCPPHFLSVVVRFIRRFQLFYLSSDLGIYYSECKL